MTERVARKSTSRQALGRGVEAPLLWTFDGPFITCLYDLEDALRRAIVQVGDVSRIAILLELSLPRMHARIQSGESIQPGWGRFLSRVDTRYGLPAPPRVRYVKTDGPLVTMLIAYRS
ncbi:MAG: hypothetical protein E6H66_01020 [Betaproteobacteria bacterium]|nr:MAG: hypothetical protein E6H66_01020 [Betaproteobacteria bacterium]